MSSNPRSRWLRRLYLPAYGVKEAARLADVHRTTVSAWYFGRASSPGKRAPGVLGDRERSHPLSYLQLVEVAFVATLRHMGVPLRRIRVARDYLARRFDTDFPFARLDLKTDGATVLYDLGQEEGEWVTDLLMVDAGAAGQTIWADPIRERIQQFDYDGPLRLAIRWFPRGRDALVVVDPQIQFGAPILREHGLATAVVRERYEAGDTIPEIEDDYGIDSACVRYALEFEGVTLAAAA